MLQAFVAVQLQWPLREMIFLFYQNLLDRCTCSEMEYYKVMQYCKKMSQAMENKECLELQQLATRFICISQNQTRWEDMHLENVYTVTIGMDNRLVNKTLVKDLSQVQTYHNGGAMVTAKNGSVYMVVGDAGSFGKLQNHPTGEPDDTSVIFRLVPPGPYYAIGIRNSFGLTIDPVTGNLWDTENGPDWGDEVNIVPPGFNSGWDVVAGPANKTQLATLPGDLISRIHIS